MDYFSGILGQERALLPLRRALETEKINHAYLFIGPIGIGKFTTAQTFARAIILRSDPQGDVYLKENAHPDLMIIERLEGKTLIGIEQINQVMEPWLALKPYRSSRRVVLIKEAHLLSLPAANALLKTLEEPPGYSVIILISDEKNLLETIISRCQLVRFSLLTESNIRDILVGKGIEAENAAHISRMGQGSMTVAFLLAEEDSREELWNVAQSHIKAMASGQEIEVFRCAEILDKNPALMVNLLINLLRDIYIYQSTGQSSFLSLEKHLEFCENFKRLDPAKVQKAIPIIEHLRKLYNGPVNSLLLSINISYQLWDALK